MFDHAQSARLGQKTPVESPGVFLCTIATMPEVAWRGMLIYLIDSDELKVYDGTVWRDAGSATPGQQTHVGPTEPAPDYVGQQWVNTTDYKVYVWNGTAWVTTREEERRDTFSAFMAVRLAAAVEPLIDGEPEIQIWYGSAAPTTTDSYWFWVNTTTNATYQRNLSNTAWSVITGEAGKIIALAGLDRSLADEAIYFYLTGLEPAGQGPEDIGDVWLDSMDPQRKVYVYTGAGWVVANTLAGDLLAGDITAREILDNTITPGKVSTNFAQSMLISGSQLTEGELQAQIDLGSGGLTGTDGTGSVLLTGGGIRLNRSDGTPRAYLPTSDEETAFIEGESHFDSSTIDELNLPGTASVSTGAVMRVESGITPPTAPRLDSDTPYYGSWSTPGGTTTPGYYWAPAQNTNNNLLIDIGADLGVWRARTIDPANVQTVAQSAWIQNNPPYGYLSREQLIGVSHLTGSNGWRLYFISDRISGTNQVMVYSRRLTLSGSTFSVSSHAWGGQIDIGTANTANISINNITSEPTEDIMVVPIVGAGFRMWRFTNATGRITQEASVPNPPVTTLATSAHGITIDNASRVVWCDRVYLPAIDGSVNTSSAYWQVAYKNKFWNWNAAWVPGTGFAGNTAGNWDGTWPHLTLAAARVFNGTTRTWTLADSSMLVGYSNAGGTYLYKPTNYWYAGTQPSTVVSTSYLNSVNARQTPGGAVAVIKRKKRTALRAYDWSALPTDPSDPLNAPNTRRWWHAEVANPASVPPSSWRYLWQDPNSVYTTTKPSATSPAYPTTSTFLSSTAGRIISGVTRTHSYQPVVDIRGDGTGRIDAVTPPGTVLLWSASTTIATPPPGFLFADGGDYLITSYPDLAGQYWNGSAYQFGGTGGTTFKTPSIAGPVTGARYIVKT